MVAFALSLAVNLAFLIGASTLLKTDSEIATDASDYITLERVELSVPGPVDAPKPVNERKDTEQPSPPIVADTTGANAGSKPLSKASANALPAHEIAFPTVKPKPASRAPESPNVEESAEVSKTDTPPVSVGENIGKKDTGNVSASGSTDPGTPGRSPGTDGSASPAPTASPGQALPAPAAPAPTATPAGETRSAEVAHQELPRIPAFIREGDYNPSVQVAVDVLPNGTFSVTLRTSSGNPEVDAYVLNALKQWKWKPALKDGEPVASTQLLKFDFASN